MNDDYNPIMNTDDLIIYNKLENYSDCIFELFNELISYVLCNDKIKYQKSLEEFKNFYVNEKEIYEKIKRKGKTYLFKSRVYKSNIPFYYENLESIVTDDKLELIKIRIYNHLNALSKNNETEYLTTMVKQDLDNIYLKLILKQLAIISDKKEREELLKLFYYFVYTSYDIEKDIINNKYDFNDNNVSISHKIIGQLQSKSDNEIYDYVIDIINETCYNLTLNIAYLVKYDYEDNKSLIDGYILLLRGCFILLNEIDKKAFKQGIYDLLKKENIEDWQLKTIITDIFVNEQSDKEIPIVLSLKP